MIKYLCLLDENSQIPNSLDYDDVIILNETKQCHYDYFSINHLKFYRTFGTFIQTEAIDLLNISLFVYFADKLVERSKAFDSWTRSIKLILPVYSIDKFDNNKHIFVELLSYLSGDHWELEFYKRTYTEIEEHENYTNNVIEAVKPHFTSISMLSGGLDSYIGAIDLLENRMQYPLFISVYGGGNDVTPYQKKVKELLKEKYNLDDLNFLSFHAKALHPLEQSTRTRSFMFFSHAIAVSTLCEDVSEIIIPENGFISLNVPLTNSRLGSSSTRTTHPYYMNLLNQITGCLGIGVRLVNPYQFKTKGEMITECNNNDFLESTLHITMSCSHSSHSRWTQDSMSSHCGYCVPCVIRRAAINYARITDKSIYRTENIKINKSYMSDTVYANLNSFKFALEKFKNKNQYGFDIQISGPLGDNIQEYIGIYKRGMEEILALFKRYDNE